MKKILIASSTVGAGHAVRDAQLARLIQEHRRDGEVIHLAGTDTMQAGNGGPHQIWACLRPTAVPASNGRLMGSQFLPGWVKADLDHAVQVARCARQLRPKLILLDELHCAVPLLRSLGYPVIFMTDMFALGEAGSGRWGARRWPELMRLLIRWASGAVFLGDTRRVDEERWQLWIERNMVCPGSVAALRPPEPEQADRIRARYPGKKLIVVTAGGSAAGEHLLQMVVEAFEQIRRRVADAVMVVACGPGIDPARIRREMPGLEVHHYLPDLTSWLAASDLVITQAGLCTLEEIAQVQAPALIVPLENHPEQIANAAYFSRHYGMRRMEADALGPDRLADAVVRIFKRFGPEMRKKYESMGPQTADNSNGVDGFLELIDRFL